MAPDEIVSIVVPCLNEVGRIGDLLHALLEQTYREGEMEVLVVDGGSTDGTIEWVQQFAREHVDLNLRLIDNPRRIIPAAVNRGIEASSGSPVIRLDAHSAPEPDYVERCLEVLEETGASNVGGMWQIEPGAETWQARSIAVAAAHPLGAGGARYRVSGPAGPVETVPFGAFPRKWLERVGPFNEDLLTNEDYEYNVRIRQAGGTVWFDPTVRSTYYARPRLRELARQYARYGYWKAQMLRLFPGSLRWRQALPPLFVGLSLILLLLSPIWWIARGSLLGLWVVYSAVLFVAGVGEAISSRDLYLLIGLPLALMVMHLTWGLAFLWGLLRKAKGA